MCGFTYDEDYNEAYRSQFDNYKVSVRLDMYYSWQRNHKPGETEKEYYKRMGWTWPK